MLVCAHNEGELYPTRVVELFAPPRPLLNSGVLGPGLANPPHLFSHVLTDPMIRPRFATKNPVGPLLVSDDTMRRSLPARCLLDAVQELLQNPASGRPIVGLTL